MGGEGGASIYRKRLGEEGTVPAVVAAQPGTPLQQGSALLSFWGGRLFSSLAVPQVATDSSCGSSEDNDSSNIGGGSITPSSSPQQQTRGRGRPKSEALAYDTVQLLQSLGLEGGDPVKLRTSFEGLAAVRQEALLHHAASVVEYLRGLGLSQATLEQLFVRCPQLFSWPVEQRAAKQFHQLMHADGDSGLTVAEAALCLLKRPTAANTPDYRFTELAATLAHSEDSSMGPKPKVPAAQRTVAALLRQAPRAAGLVCMPEGKLQWQIDRLVTTGCTLADVAKLVWRQPQLFSCTGTDAAAKLEQAIDVLGAELGLPAAEVLAPVRWGAPRWLQHSRAVLQQRAATLAEVFGKGAAASMVSQAPAALDCPPHVWQCNMHYMAACGVADPKTVLTHNAILLGLNHAADGFVARRLLLQRYYGHTAEQLYERHAPYLVKLRAIKLAQRLQYVKHRGQLHLLPNGASAKLESVVKAATAEQHLGSSSQRVLSLCALCFPAERFLSALGSSEEEWEVFAAEHPEGTGPVWEWAQREAQLEIERLKAALPAEVRKAAELQQKGYHKQRKHQSP